jgi:hypothetical protein
MPYDNDKRVYYRYEYHDEQLKKIVFRCEARDRVLADLLFKNETGADPEKLNNILRRIDGWTRR